MGLKVVVFSNFPEALVENDIRPKLLRYGVEILRVVNVDRSSRSDVQDADAVVAMVELMSNIQRQNIKDIAKSQGKKFYPLTRNSSDWASHFGDPVPPSQAPQTVPSSRLSPPTQPSAMQLLLKQSEQARKDAESRVAALQEELAKNRENNERIKHSRDQLAAEVTKLASRVKGLDEYQQELEISLRKEQVIREGHLLQIVSLRELKDSQAEELFRLKKTAEVIPITVAANDSGLSWLGKFLEQREAYKVLWQSRSVKPDEILTFLMGWKRDDSH